MNSVGTLFLGLRNRFDNRTRVRTEGYQAVLREDPKNHQESVQEDTNPANHGTLVSSQPLSQVIPNPQVQSSSNMVKIVQAFLQFLQKNEVDESFLETKKIFFRQLSLFAKASLENKEFLVDLLRKEAASLCREYAAALNAEKKEILRRVIVILSLQKLGVK